MKLEKLKYFSIILLLSYLASFGINSYKSSLYSFNKDRVTYSKKVSISTHTCSNNTQGSNVCEETENDLVDEFTAIAFTLPYVISFAHFVSIHASQIFANPLAENQHNPIYISVCNFRI